MRCSRTTTGRAALDVIPNVVGRTFHFGDGVYQTIVGVSEKKFTGTEPGPLLIFSCRS